MNLHTTEPRARPKGLGAIATHALTWGFSATALALLLIKFGALILRNI
jgi:hypothetical protein